jgi:hypothetical protein
MDLEEYIKKRIAELEADLQRYVTEANHQVEMRQVAIVELKAVLDPSLREPAKPEERPIPVDLTIEKKD